MNERQRYALTHPLNDAQNIDAIVHRRSIRQRGDGSILVVILAVDR